MSKRKDDESSPKRPGVKPLQVHLGEELMAALLDMLDKHRPKTDRTAIVTDALEQYLHKKGYWKNEGDKKPQEGEGDHGSSGGASGR